MSPVNIICNKDTNVCEHSLFLDVMCGVICFHTVCVFDVHSYKKDLVLCSGFDKSLEVFDLNVGSVVQSISEVHSKPVHAIVQNKVLIILR